MKKFKRISIATVLLLLMAWLFLTIWAEKPGPKISYQLGFAEEKQKALIVYDPDPFYNLDQQVCESFGKALSEKNWNVRIASVTAAATSNIHYDLYVFCANTYNWAPDWELTGFLKQANLQDKNVIAITVGGGSSTRSQKLLENLLEKKRSHLIGSKTFWLWRPNDEKRMKESNVKVANDIVYTWAMHIADSLQNTPTPKSFL